MKNALGFLVQSNLPRRKLRAWLGFQVALLSLYAASVKSSAQEIVLRDLTRIREVAVSNVEDAGVKLANDRLLTWDLILQANVDASLQAKIDQGVTKFGLPLYRLKYRIKQKNIEGAFEIADQWFQSPDQSLPGVEANFLVAHTVMLGRISGGETARAVEPMILAIQLQEQCSEEFLTDYKEFTFETEELKSRICGDFLPVWGSVEETASELDRLESKFDLNTLVQKYPALSVYLSSMAVHAGQRERMEPWNVSLGSVYQLRPWQRLLNSDLARSPLSRLLDESDGAIRVTTMFWWATAQDQTAPKRQRLLTLLKIIANYSQQHPVLAEQARVAAIELNDDPRLAQLLQQSEQ